MLVNTAIAAASDPVKMAEAFKYAVQAASLAVNAGPAPVSHYANPSSPVKGLLKDIL